jgi:hypothetical protein
MLCQNTSDAIAFSASDADAEFVGHPVDELEIKASDCEERPGVSAPGVNTLQSGLKLRNHVVGEFAFYSPVAFQWERQRVTHKWHYHFVSQVFDHISSFPEFAPTYL